jgi:DNA polymerase V
MTTTDQIKIMLPKPGALPIHLPLFGHKVPAGFPSPADDHMEALISLDEELIHHKAATFFVRAKGNSMTGTGIHDGDILVVDKSLEPISGDIVIASVDGNITVKRFIKEGSIIKLKPENPQHQEIIFHEGQELQIWGVVTSSTTKHKFI